MYPRVRLRPLLRADGRGDQRGRQSRLRLSAGVEKVHREGNRVTGGDVSHAGRARRRIEAANYVSSIPLTLLAKIMDPAAPAEVIAAANALTFRNVITVNLMLKKRQVTADTWLYVHDRNILFGRLPRAEELERGHGARATNTRRWWSSTFARSATRSGR